MNEVNLISSFRTAKYVRTNSKALAVIFYLYHNQKKKVSEIIEDLNLKDKTIINELEQEGFIEQNPHPKEEDRTFVLSFGGMILIKELAEDAPELIKEL